jgi:hypothetical protein
MTLAAILSEHHAITQEAAPPFDVQEKTIAQIQQAMVDKRITMPVAHECHCVKAAELVRVTRESWRAPWSYFLVAPPAHFRRPVVRAFVAKTRGEATAA